MGGLAERARQHGFDDDAYGVGPQRGGDLSVPGAGDHPGGPLAESFVATATPRRPDTRGRVEWSTTQPRVGQELTPTLIDPDAPALAEAHWRWRRQRWPRSAAGDSLSAPAPGSRSGESKLAVIARTRQYRPQVSDLNQWLWVEVTYTDDYTDDSGRHRVSATTLRAVGPGPPCAPANLKAAPGDGQVTLTWEAGCDNGGTIDRYQYRRLDAVKWVRVPGDGSARRQQVTGLTNGEAHTFEVRAGNGQGPGPSAQATATPEAGRTVFFAAAAYQASEGGDAATVTVRLSRAVSQALTIPITVTRDADTEQSDYTVAGLTNGALSITPGTTSQTFTVTANQDVDQDDETVSVGFGTLPSEVSAGTPATATVTLIDDDVPVPRVSFGASSYSAAEGGDAATVTVRLSQAAPANLTIPITITADEGTEEDDFSHSLGTAKTLLFSAGTTSTRMREYWCRRGIGSGAPTMRISGSPPCRGRAIRD